MQRTVVKVLEIVNIIFLLFTHIACIALTIVVVNSSAVVAAVTTNKLKMRMEEM